MVDWALSFCVDLVTALCLEYRSRMQVQMQEEVRESVHRDFVLSEGIGHSRKD